MTIIRLSLIRTCITMMPVVAIMTTMALMTIMTMMTMMTDDYDDYDDYDCSPEIPLLKPCEAGYLPVLWVCRREVGVHHKGFGKWNGPGRSRDAQLRIVSMFPDS